jgi:SAM-dependent methyltransferase
LFQDAPGVSITSYELTRCTVCLEKNSCITISVPADPLSGADKTASAHYHACGHCGSLRITEVPNNLAAYYEGTYYSMTRDEPSGFRRVLQKARDRGAVFGRPFLFRLLAEIYSDPRMSQLRQLTKGDLDFELSRSSRILDVGCGAGNWLRRLERIGFRDLTGCDPFLVSTEQSATFKLFAVSINDMLGCYDFIMCSHALEHMIDPEASLLAMAARLSPDGILAIRIPLMASSLWSEFGGYWVQLDAPRHLTLYSQEGFCSVVDRLGLKVERVQYDAHPFSVLGSIARSEGLLPHSQTQEDNLRKAAITKENMIQATALVQKYNREGTSDQATFFLSLS